MTYRFQAIYATRAPQFVVRAHCLDYARALAHRIAPRAYAIVLRGMVRA